MKNKSHGLEINDVLTYNEYLDNANAEQSPDTAPTLIPVLEDGNITMKSFHEELAKAGKILELSQDFSNAIAMIENEHWQIHKGKHYFYDDYIALGNAETADFVFIPDGKADHLTFEATGNEAGIEVLIYEDITSNDDGTEIQTFNNNRLSSNITDGVIKLNPTGIDLTGALRLKGILTGAAGNPNQSRAGEASRDNELILNNTKKYLFRVRNLGSSTNNVDIIFRWYEI